MGKYIVRICIILFITVATSVLVAAVKQNDWILITAGISLLVALLSSWIIFEVYQTQKRTQQVKNEMDTTSKKKAVFSSDLK